MPNQFTYPSHEERFWVKVDKSGGEDACWLWIAHRNENGYGTFGWKGNNSEKAHRVAYELAYGVAPEQLYVLHTCDNPPCVNPKHLFLGTHQDNTDDRDRKGRNVVQYGENHWATKIPDDKVTEIRMDFVSGKKSQKTLCEENNMTTAAMGNILRYITHTRTTDGKMFPVVFFKTSQRKIRDRNHKLEACEFDAIRAEYATGTFTTRQLAEIHHVSNCFISKIINRKSRL